MRMKDIFVVCRVCGAMIEECTCKKCKVCGQIGQTSCVEHHGYKSQADEPAGTDAINMDNARIRTSGGQYATATT